MELIEATESLQEWTEGRDEVTHSQTDQKVNSLISSGEDMEKLDVPCPFQHRSLYFRNLKQERLKCRKEPFVRVLSERKRGDRKSVV